MAVADGSVDFAGEGNGARDGGGFVGEAAARDAPVVDGGNGRQERGEAAGGEDGLAVGEALLVADGEGGLVLDLFGAVVGVAVWGDDRGGAGPVGEFAGGGDVDAADDGDAGGVAQALGVGPVEGVFLAGGLDGVDVADAVLALGGGDLGQVGNGDAVA